MGEPVRIITRQARGTGAGGPVMTHTPTVDGWRPTHRHIKTGGLYRALMDAELESDLSPVMVYQGADGRVRVRPRDEFHDAGRFELLDAGGAGSSPAGESDRFKATRERVDRRTKEWSPAKQDFARRVSGAPGGGLTLEDGKEVGKDSGFTEDGVWVGSYVRINTRVLGSYPTSRRLGTVTDHDDAWNCKVEFDKQEYPAASWLRAGDVLRADGTPLQPSDLTTVKGAEISSSQVAQPSRDDLGEPEPVAAPDHPVDTNKVIETPAPEDDYAGLAAENDRLKGLLVDANNRWRHEFFEEVSTAAETLFKRLGAYNTDPFNRTGRRAPPKAENERLREALQKIVNFTGPDGEPGNDPAIGAIARAALKPDKISRGALVAPPAEESERAEDIKTLRVTLEIDVTDLSDDERATLNADAGGDLDTPERPMPGLQDTSAEEAASVLDLIGRQDVQDYLFEGSDVCVKYVRCEVISAEYENTEERLAPGEKEWG